ncbi:MAG TPA: hypothetical protein GXX46_13060 [Peptococcaceae bacterium]|nr:hypothetical protein [Peptococcaceae bacterium]
MNKDHFAKSFGFVDYEEMVDNSTTVFRDKDVSWSIAKLPHGKYLTWDDAEIADDRVEVFFTREEAEEYLSVLRNKAKAEKKLPIN